MKAAEGRGAAPLQHRGGESLYRREKRRAFTEGGKASTGGSRGDTLQGEHEESLNRREARASTGGRRGEPLQKGE